MSEENKTEEIEIKKPENKKNINITFIIVALIIAFAYIYVENGKIAYQEKIKAEQEINQRHQKVEYENCLSEAYIDYNTTWNKSCKRMKKKDDCALPAYNANSIEKSYSERKIQCMEKLKNNAF